MALPNALELVPLHTLLFQWHERISFSIGGVKHVHHMSDLLHSCTHTFLYSVIFPILRYLHKMRRQG